MKKSLIFILSVISLFLFSACAGQPQQNAQSSAMVKTTQDNVVTVETTTEPQLLEVTSFNGSFEMQDSDGNTYITADDIKSAKAKTFEGYNQYLILIEFNEEGTQKFADATGKLIGEELKMIVDGETICSPIINSQITDGKTQIEGDFTLEQVNDILLKMQG